MKTAKSILVAMVVFVAMTTSSCGSEFAGGAAVGAAATGAVVGASNVLDAKSSELQTQYESALARLEKATSETEKLAAEAELNLLAKQLEKVQTEKQVTDTITNALKTNWSDPQSVSNFATAAAILWGGWYVRRKMKSGATVMAATDKEA